MICSGTANEVKSLQKAKWYQKSDMIVALSAIVVSVAAVGVGVYSAYIERSFARASTWPHLEVFRSFNYEPALYSLLVNNQGTGPAIIHYAILEQDGAQYVSWNAWVEDQFPVPQSYFTQSHIGSRVLSTGQSVTVFTTTAPDLARAIRKADDVNLTLCYCSVYEECWLTDRSNKKQDVDDCDLPDQDIFSQ